MQHHSITLRQPTRDNLPSGTRAPAHHCNLEPLRRPLVSLVARGTKLRYREGSAIVAHRGLSVELPHPAVRE